MTGSKLEWVEVLRGWEQGSPARRDVVYDFPKFPASLFRPKAEIGLTYQVGGFWVGPCAADAEYQTAHIPQARLSRTPGAPSLPMDVFSLALPRGADLDPADLVVADVRSRDVEGSYRFAPAAVPTVEGEPTILVPDPAVYESDAWYPETVASCTAPSEVDGLLRTVVSLYPLAWAPRSGRLRLRTHIALRLPCRVPERGTYTEAVKWRSPLVRAIVGHEQLAPH